MDAAAEALSGRGARVLGRFTQRRGVSDGGVARMALPFSSRTLLRQGKVREVAEACARSGADAVVFLPSLTERQRRALTDALGCPAVGLDKVLGGG
ncbi:hypothetical protein ASE09_32300 [Streptomyces sp. Root66D1]|nr:hypothetical protein ASD33_32510 [Streptomyces sp. Root1304]KRA93602.1 hypothetical protein ASE09_32300 [Streptomyces sp. Root66D1]